MTRFTNALLLPLVAVGLAGCFEEAKLQVADGTGPDPKLPPPNKTLLPTVNIADDQGLGGRGQADAGAGLEVVVVRRAGSTIRAGSTCCPTATCWSPRATRRRSPRTSRASRAGSWAC